MLPLRFDEIDRNVVGVPKPRAPCSKDLGEKRHEIRASYSGLALNQKPRVQERIRGLQPKAFQGGVVQDRRRLRHQCQTDDLIPVMRVALRVEQREHQRMPDGQRRKNDRQQQSRRVEDKQQVDDNAVCGEIVWIREPGQVNKNARDPPDEVAWEKATPRKA